MSMFPSIQPAEVETEEGQELPLCQEVAWDFEHGVPIFRQGEPVIVTGAEAVKVWVWKALRTPRYQYDIYSLSYGSDLPNLIGQAYTPTLKEAEAPRYLREALLINPYIQAVNNIRVNYSDGSLQVSGEVQTIYGEVTIDATV